MAGAKKVKVGIIGCGAIGSRMARDIQKSFGAYCRLTGLYDINPGKAEILARSLRKRGIVKRSITDLITDCDCMIEATSAPQTHHIIRQALKAQKTVLAMSVGKLLNFPELFSFAQKCHTHLLIPSGAIAGIDAIKAASLVGISSIILTTRKPLSGFTGNPYLMSNHIDLTKIKKETVLFEGGVNEAVRSFPQNINVAATIALASGCRAKLKVRIITSPEYTVNTHEIELKGKFGQIRTQTDNTVCPDNPKTSYLAVLSGLQTLRQFCSGVFVGT